METEYTLKNNNFLIVWKNSQRVAAGESTSCNLKTQVPTKKFLLLSSDYLHLFPVREMILEEGILSNFT